MRIAIPAALFAVAGVMLATQVRSSNRVPPGVSTRAFFTTSDQAAGEAALAALFVDDANRIPPFDHDGQPAYRAQVYTAGGKRWVNHLVRYDAATKARLEADVAANVRRGVVTGPDTAELGDAGLEVKRPGPDPWLTLADPGFAMAQAVTPPSGVGRGGDVDVVTP